MHHVSTTPFGQRPVTAALMKAIEQAEQPAPVPQIDKWEVFRQLCVARQAYQLSDRDMTVLNALLSFHQGNTISDNERLTVFPSNRRLSERAHGMAESTLRRHIAALVQAGVILRHDSPNGKRYAARDGQGDVVRAYGFSLRPLLTRSGEIAEKAAEVEAQQERLRALRAEATLLKRDTLKFALYGQESGAEGAWEQVLDELMTHHRALRRKLGAEELEKVVGALKFLADRVTKMLGVDSEKMSGNDDENERHLQNSKPDSPDLEPCLEKQEAATERETSSIRIPLALVLKACPDIAPYHDGDIRSWVDLTRAAAFVRGMMGVSPSGYSQACASMGEVTAAITLACILQRIDKINSPGGYLTALARQAGEGRFSPGPMVMALLNGKEAGRS